MTDKFSWFRSLPRFAGILVGMALTAIGGVMSLNVVLKIYVFGFDTNSYFNVEEMCRIQDYALAKEGEKPAPLTSEEHDTCLTEKAATESHRYLRQKKESLVDGFAMLLIGIPFWIIFGRKEKV